MPIRIRAKPERYYLKANQFLHDDGKATKTFHTKVEVLQLLIHHYKFTPGNLENSERVFKKFVEEHIEKSAKRFFTSQSWKRVRYAALKRSNGKCELCNRGKEDGVVLHVDHIKPKSKYPELALKLNNLQVLCGDCNFGKSNKDETDWR